MATHTLEAALNAPGVHERSARVIRLKEELNRVLELVVHSREALQNELSSEIAQKKLSIDKAFLAKLKELTACFNSLTASRISLDKAEKQLEKEMTPAEEKEAVFNYVASLDAKEAYQFIKAMWAAFQARSDLAPIHKTLSL